MVRQLRCTTACIEDQFFDKFFLPFTHLCLFLGHTRSLSVSNGLAQGLCLSGPGCSLVLLCACSCLMICFMLWVLSCLLDLPAWFWSPGPPVPLAQASCHQMPLLLPAWQMASMQYVSGFFHCGGPSLTIIIIGLPAVSQWLGLCTGHRVAGCYQEKGHCIVASVPNPQYNLF